MNIEEMTLTEVNERIDALDAEVRSMTEVEAIEHASEEKSALLTRKAELEALEKRKQNVIDLTSGKVSGNVLEEIKEERKMDIMEFRNTKQYIDAFAEYIKSGDETELRALLTNNVEGGTIAVPTFVLDIVKTAWDKNDLLSRINTTDLPGNLQVQFEISGDDAVVHTEGSGAVAEETLTEGIATLKPESIKKWISISDEAMDLRGEPFLQYIYSELAYRIAKKAADNFVAILKALPTTATATTVSAPKISAAPALGTVAEAIGNLSDEAANPVIIMNKLTWSAFKKAQYDGNYAVDPFEGLPVVFNNSLPAYSAATAGNVYMIVGDLGHGGHVNFPNGRNITFKFDEMSRKKEDLVEILGRQYVAMNAVACKAFVNVAKPTHG